MRTRWAGVAAAYGVLLASLLACSSGGGAGGSSVARDGGAPAPSANDSTVCAAVTKSVMESCPGQAPQIDSKCGSYDRCVAGCVLANMCNQSASSSCAARCVSSTAPSGASSSSASPTGSSNPLPSASTSSETATSFPQCVGYADTMCKCYPAGSKTQCTASERSTCETYFSTCPTKASTYYGCAGSHLDCNDANSLDACSKASQSAPCN